MSIDFSSLSNCIRFLSMDMVQKANSGHPGMPMGMADVVTILFSKHLNFNPKDPFWASRDRFVLSAGHGSALLYSLLYLNGYARPTIDDLKSFRNLHSVCAGHPEFGYMDGIETTTGPLGQGFGNAVGMAIAQKKHEKDLGLDYKIYALVSDGDLMEGISHEVGSLAGHLNLDNIILLFDDNGITIDGPSHLSISEDPLERFRSYGFHIIRIDGHDFNAINTALDDAKKCRKPCIISCKTIIGKGSPKKQGTASSHGSPLGEDEIKLIRKQQKWDYEPFVIPDELFQQWRAFHQRSLKKYDKTMHIKLPYRGMLDNKIFEMIKGNLHAEKPQKATRVLFQKTLHELCDKIPFLIGGSADLTPSNNTKTNMHTVFDKNNFTGSYIHYGIREHGMGAIMNGLALSGFLPYGGTFLAFSDYMRPTIRLSAIMKQQVFYIFTHDSIGLGEDGPTHQPVEHLCALRAIPNVYVFRPCDAAEMIECWQTALLIKDAPSLFILSRQSLPYLRDKLSYENKLRLGAYILSEEESSNALDITLVGTGSEVHLCIEAQAKLEKEGKSVRVVSMPCLDLFKEMPKEKQQKIIGNPKKVIAVEAGLGTSLKEALMEYKPCFVGIDQFGLSAPCNDIFNHFNITADEICNKALGYYKFFK